MARWRRNNYSGILVLCVVLILLTLYFAAGSIEVLSRPTASYPPGSTAAAEIGKSAFLGVIALCLFAPFAVWGPFSRGRFPQEWSNYGRLLYTWACGLTLLHIAVAFHVAHEWSHSRAFDHVEAASRFGAGLYVNYLFAALWLADVVWAWMNLKHYLIRSRWVGWGFLVFMAFIVFNAAVVFGTGTRRWVSAILFVVPLYAIWATWPHQTHEPGSKPGSKEVQGISAGHSPT
jgi:hypothetical protein